jgi:(2Fe-2S) ferredoxin
VASFYSSFSLKPRGRHIVCACLGTACHVRGAPLVVEELERQLGVKPGETTPSGEFTLQTANCLGACALGPVVVVNGRYFSKVPKAKVAKLIDTVRTGSDQTDAERDERRFPVMASCPQCRRSLKDENTVIDGLPSIRLRASAADGGGWLWLSALYGSHRSSSEHEIPLHTVVELSCPHCQVELGDSWTCPRCEAPMASMAVDGGGTVRICRRRGCTSHMLDLT